MEGLENHEKLVSTNQKSILPLFKQICLCVGPYIRSYDKLKRGRHLLKHLPTDFQPCYKPLGFLVCFNPLIYSLRISYVLLFKSSEIKIT